MEYVFEGSWKEFKELGCSGPANYALWYRAKEGE